MAERRVLAGNDTRIADEARRAGPNVGDGGEEDEGVGYGPYSLEEAVGNEDQEHPKQTQRGANPLDVLDGVPLCLCEIHVALTVFHNFRRLFDLNLRGGACELGHGWKEGRRKYLKCI